MYGGTTLAVSTRESYRVEPFHPIPKESMNNYATDHAPDSFSTNLSSRETVAAESLAERELPTDEDLVVRAQKCDLMALKELLDRHEALAFEALGPRAYPAAK